MVSRLLSWACVGLLWLGVLSAAPAAGQDQGSACWQLPRQCYGMEIDLGDLKIALAGVEAGGMLITLEDAKDSDWRQEMICFARVASHGISCSHYYVCKPRIATPLAMDTDSADMLEIRWTEEAAARVRAVELRHGVDALGSRIEAGRWLRFPVSFRHWQSMASGAPQCWLKLEGG